MRLDTLRDVYATEGPFVTVHLDVSRTSEHGRDQLDARVTNLRHELENGGVDAALIEDITSRIAETSHLPGDVRRTIVASAGSVVLDETRVGSTSSPESTVVGPLPDLAGWVDQVAAEVPFLLVLADREGADLELHVAPRQPADVQTEVNGDTLHLHKTQQGDMAQKQYQRRSDNVWRRNAHEVADEIRTICTQHAPALVVLAGDVRARTEIVDALDNPGVPVEQVESGGRADGASEEALWEDVDTLITRHVERATDDVLEEIGTATANGRAAHGVDDVLDALVRAEVDRVVLELGAARSMQVVPSRFPGLALPVSAAESDESFPADQVLLAAAAATDAAVQLVPGTPEESDGVSALLRWSHDG
jgi:hypothetical protein